MGLDFLERGVRKPHKGTVQKVENGLGLPPGTYARLVVAQHPDTELAQLIAGQPLPETRRDSSAVVVERHTKRRCSRVTPKRRSRRSIR